MAKKSEEKIVRSYVDDKTGAKMEVVMKESTTTIKNADGTKTKKVVWSGEYHRPIDLENGMLHDGEDKVTALYQVERLTNFLDEKRRAQGEGKRAKMTQLLIALEAGDIETTVALMKDLGLQGANLKALLASKDETEDETEE